MKGFAALAIAAMLVVQVAVTFVGTVSAGADEAIVTFDRVKVQGGWSGILTLTVANSAGAAIDSVTLHTIPDGWGNFAPVKKVSKDNIVVAVPEDNLVVLPVGTIIYLMENDNLLLPENTRVVVQNGKSIYYPTNNGTTTLQQDTVVEVRQDTLTENVENQAVSVPGYVENAVDNFRVAYNVPFEITDNRSLRLLKDTYATYVSATQVRLVENTEVQVFCSVDNALTDNRVTVLDNVVIKLKDNHVRAVTDKPANSMNWNILSGDNLELTDDWVVILPGTVIQLCGHPLVRIAENTTVIRENGREIDITSATVENVPRGWAQDAANRSWTGIGDNKIVANASENFPFAITAPNAAGTYTFYMWIKDTAGSQKTRDFKITVDNSVTVNVSVDKAWVGKNENITITVSSDEPIWFDNVLVCENNAPENVNIEMSTTDNKTYTGTYTTGDNESRDGYLTIRVINARDEVGITKPEIIRSDLVFVDRWRPGPPSLTALKIPVGIENKSDWPISPTLDNSHDNLIFTPSGYSPENLMLEVLVDNGVVASGRADATGLVSFTLTLSEGKHTVAARITDKAGNVGEENCENNVVIDTSKPTVTFVSPTRGKLGKADIGADNTITISLKLRDTVLGIENYEMENTDEEADNENFDRGYIVRLYKDSAVIAILEPRSYPTLENVENVLPNVFGITADWTFENTYSLGASPQGKYTVEVIAGDSMGVQAGKGPHRVKENVSFEVDLTAPNDPDEDTCTGSLEGGKSQFEPTKTRISRLTLMGTTEPNATVKIYSSVAGGAWTVLTTASAGSDGKWSKDVDLPEGQTMGLKVSYVDEAGNESGMYLYGYLLFDDNPPTVTIDAQYKEFSTDKASVLITGRVQKDTWEDYNDIELSVAPATAAVNFNRTNGTFTVSAPVSEGTNLITVEAKDPVGNRGSDTAVVTRTVTPWATYATILVIVALVLAAVAIFRKK